MQEVLKRLSRLPDTDLATIAERDSQIIWHPYTQMQNAGNPIVIKSGRGAIVTDESGREYIDAVSSWWVNLHGHAHPYIASKISEQATKLEHVIFAGFTHAGAVELGERLLSILPDNQGKVFYSDNGSTAVEVALKMAFQFWYNKGIPKKKIVAFEEAYHGDTFGSMSVSGASAFTKPFEPMCFDVIRIPAPIPGNETSSLEKMNKSVSDNDVAAFIFEPVVLGASGMLMYDAKYLDSFIEICRQKNILTIADEVFTGFGRTGKLFACEYISHKPDIFCLSKGITGGFMPFGATTCTDEIYNAFLSENKLHTFFHGHSYTANPLACAAAIASFDLLTGIDCKRQLEFITKSNVDFAKRISEKKYFKDVRTLGTILAVEIKSEEGYFDSRRDFYVKHFLDRGILIRPLGNVIYIVPPYCIQERELKRVYDAILNLCDN